MPLVSDLPLMYTRLTMKKGLHPEYKATKVSCNGCNTSFETHSTVDAITVEICSNCHPFYTGKQKLVDVAGRVDKFKARQAAASDHRSKNSKEVRPPQPEEQKPDAEDSQADLQELKKELEKSER